MISSIIEPTPMPTARWEIDVATAAFVDLCTGVVTRASSSMVLDCIWKITEGRSIEEQTHNGIW